jgi:hypothetical protein
LRFLYKKTLKRRDLDFDDLPLLRTPKKLPVVLSPEEVTRLIEAAPNLLYRTMLMLLYATGLRRGDSLIQFCDLPHTIRSHGLDLIMTLKSRQNWPPYQDSDFKELVELSIGGAPFSCLVYPPTTESHVLTPSAWGPVVDWRQSDAHRPVSGRLLAFPLMVDLALRQKSAQTPCLECSRRFCSAICVKTRCR